MASAIKEGLTAGALLKPVKEIKGKEGIEKAVALSTIITQIIIDALKAFLNRDLLQFDAPVGDNSCKIRASVITDLCDKLDRDESFANEIQQVINTAQKILERISVCTFHLEEKCDLMEFRRRNEWEFSISSDVAFLAQTHLLYKVKKANSYDKTDPLLLCKIAKVAPSAGKDLIFYIKQQVSIASISYVKDCISFCPLERRVILQKIFNCLEMDDKGRKILPNLYCMEVLLHGALLKRQLVVLKFKEGPMHIFQANDDRTAFQEIKETSSKRAAIIIEAVGSSEDLVITNLMKTLLIIAAIGPQYLAGENQTPIPFDKEKKDPTIQEEAGRFALLCKETPLFHIEHMQASSLS